MRDKLLQVLIIVISSILTIQLFNLQVLNKKNSDVSSKASVQKIYNFPERGYLYDRNNKLIVSNQPYYDLLIVPNDTRPTSGDPTIESTSVGTSSGTVRVCSIL